MNQGNLSIRRRWLLAALLLIPAVGRADTGYGGLFTVLLVLLIVGVALVAGFAGLFVADKRAGQPGIGFGNAIGTLLLLLAWLGTMVGEVYWLNLVLTGLLGLNGWLLAKKNLRAAEHNLQLWLAIGVVGLGWMVEAFVGMLVPLLPLPPGWRWYEVNGALLWLVVNFLLQLPGLVRLARAFFNRWPTAWPAQTVAISLQVVGLVAAIDAGLFLLQVLVGSGFDLGHLDLLGLLRNVGANVLAVGLVLLGVRWRQLREPAAGDAVA